MAESADRGVPLSTVSYLRNFNGDTVTLARLNSDEQILSTNVEHCGCTNILNVFCVKRDKASAAIIEPM